MTVTHDLAGRITRMGGPVPKLESEIKKLIKEHELFYGICIAYKPYAYSKRIKLYAPYWVRKTDKIECIRVEDMYDYTDPKYDWFNMSIKGSGWTEPYFGKASDVLVTAYGVPIYEKGFSGSEKHIVGAVVVVISLDKIKNYIKSFDLGLSGFPSLISGMGKYLYHPTADYVFLQKSIMDIAKEKNDGDRLRIAQDAIHGKGGFIEHKSVTTGLDSWLIYEPISATGWSLQNTFLKNDIPFKIQKIRRQLIRIVLCAVFFLTFAISFITLFSGRPKAFWTASILNSLILIAGIAFIWNISLRWGQCIINDGVNVLNRNSIQNFISDTDDMMREHNLKEPLYVETGVFVESFEFVNANKLRINGMVWQKYKNADLDAISPGVIMSNALDVKLTEFIRSAGRDDNTIMAWTFYGDFYQKFDYSTYPVDCFKIFISMRHKDLHKNIMLIPDINSYDILNPSSLPGLKSDFVLPGWDLEKSYFTLTTTNWNVSLGFEDESLRNNTHDMNYNIVVTRKVFNAFIQNMTTLIVVILLIFLMLLYLTSDLEMSKRLDLKPGAALRLLGSMFLVVVFVHINLRTKIVADHIFYLEYFYFITYLTLFLTAINFMLFTSRPDLSLINYKDSFISKLFYFPNMLSVLFVITSIVFY